MVVSGVPGQPIKGRCERRPILSSNIVTAGVYVNIDGYFPFQVGPTKSGTSLGVVYWSLSRISGFWKHYFECTLASLKIHPVNSRQATLKTRTDKTHPFMAGFVQVSVNRKLLLYDLDQVAASIVKDGYGEVPHFCRLQSKLDAELI
ncbi:MAG: hypothetical protein K0Q94_3725 [Paenibacillus sp.]|nr:hypothetical protein [Paenibacillus sp.]